MSGNVSAVNNAQQSQQPSKLKRAAITLAPGCMALGIFTKALTEGKNIYEAGKEVKNDFSSTHDANVKGAKAGLKSTAEAIDDCPIILGIFGYAIKGLNKAVNS